MTEVTAPAPRDSRIRTWLVGTTGDQARFAEMHRRFSSAPVYGVLIGGSHVVAATVYGWHLLLFVVVAVTTMVLSTQASRRSRTPEVIALATLVIFELDTITGVLVTGGADSPLLPLVLVPLFTQAVCFRSVVTVAATSAAAVLVVVTCVVQTALPPSPEVPPFLRVVVCLAVLGCLASASRDLAQSDSNARGTASLDALTGLFNRRALDNHFADTCARGATSQAVVGLIMLDIDHFKSINDAHGHERGDQVLQEVARRLTSTLRSGDLVYRVGGEEFVVLAPGAGAAAGQQIAERVRQAISREPICGLPVTISAGVYSAPAGGADLVTMARFADDALYTAKREGRDRVVVAEGPLPV